MKKDNTSKSIEKFSMNKAMKELEEINNWFQEEEIDLEEGLEKLQEAQKLTSLVKTKLQEVENKFIDLKKDFQEEMGE
ncbi:MAG: exodeoxyribonuclease VII small subunit [Candidatus Pacebacteria bacterium]|jgi:exodeoxyribonuclease VII small subunit|nr:exodeoxyribonuclease VII small subunit [Candidatus Paceibacterota bacterium]MBT4652251.1 exodeoxyribonuclease VII small subunit [Candidatus Paceibacterota bacterium]MBT6756663.1 exodeoxyribonuclease VII small subunit [Candidatus Paceibacterota bacterium]MBT6921421.1 exodeoxyribonuclease VII small subunit [Candidatus Paceibacterota bacterium]